MKLRCGKLKLLIHFLEFRKYKPKQNLLISSTPETFKNYGTVTGGMIKKKINYYFN